MPPSDSSHPAQSPAALRRKVHTRLAERIDPVRTRHKPISLVRQEARRSTEQFLDVECPHLTRSERDGIVEDVLAEGVGYGPLEELFRDETVKEIQVLGPGHVAARKADGWLPTGVAFRDAEQLRQVATRYADIGDAIGQTPLSGGFEVRLSNGFRVIGVMPPEGVDYPPVLLLVRGASPAVKSGVVSQPTAEVFAPSPAPAESGVVSFALPGGDSAALSGMRAGLRSGVVGRTARPTTNQPSARMPAVGLAAAAPADPYARDRERLSAFIVGKCAAAGVYDLRRIPLPQLREFVLAAVSEYAAVERMACDDVVKERLALEILANMAR